MKVGESAVILLLVLSSLGANVVAPTKAEIEAMYAAAAQELNAGNYGEALQKLDAIDARQPDDGSGEKSARSGLDAHGRVRPGGESLAKSARARPESLGSALQSRGGPFPEKKLGGSARSFPGAGRGTSERGRGRDWAISFNSRSCSTYLLENKEKKATRILDRLKASSASPAYYYAKAAFAFQAEG